MANSKKITSYTGSATEINIPTSIGGSLVREIDSNAFKDKNITKITVNTFEGDVEGSPWGATGAQIVWAKPAIEKQLVSIAFEKDRYDFESGQLIKDTDFVVNATYSDATTEQVQTECAYYVNDELKDFKTGWRIGVNGTLKAVYQTKEATTYIQNWS